MCRYNQTRAAHFRVGQAEAEVVPSGTADVQKTALLVQLSQFCPWQPGVIAWLHNSTLTQVPSVCDPSSLLLRSYMHDCCEVAQAPSDQAAHLRRVQADTGVVPSGTADVQKTTPL